MKIQLKKGVSEMCVLSLLMERAHYSYEIVMKLSSTIEIAEGTIYPLMKRLRDLGYISTFQEESSTGAPRKYYQIEELGRKEFLSQKTQWTEFSESVNKILGGQYE